MTQYIENIFTFCVDLFSSVVTFWQNFVIGLDVDFVLWFNSTFEYVPKILKDALSYVFDIFGFSGLNLGEVIISCVTNSLLIFVLARAVVLLKNLIR